MSRRIALVTGVAIVGAIFTVALLPIRRGVQIHCYGDINTRMQVRGWPFGYSSSTGMSDNVCYDAKSNIYSAQPLKDTFQTSSIWFDFIVYGAVLTAAYVLVDKARAKV